MPAVNPYEKAAQIKPSNSLKYGTTKEIAKLIFPCSKLSMNSDLNNGAKYSLAKNLLQIKYAIQSNPNINIEINITFFSFSFTRYMPGKIANITINGLHMVRNELETNMAIIYPSFNSSFDALTANPKYTTNTEATIVSGNPCNK